MNPAVLSSQTSLIIVYLASFLIWLMFAGLIILWIIDGRVKKEIVLHALFAAFISWTASQMIKSILPIERPFHVNGRSPYTLTIPTGNSFPSSHAAIAFALGFSIYLHNKKLGRIFLAVAVMVGLGRYFSNVHYIIDVAGGALLGIFVSIIVEKLHLHKLI